MCYHLSLISASSGLRLLTYKSNIWRPDCLIASNYLNFTLHWCCTFIVQARLWCVCWKLQLGIRESVANLAWLWDFFKRDWGRSRKFQLFDSLSNLSCFHFQEKGVILIVRTFSVITGFQGCFRACRGCHGVNIKEEENLLTGWWLW